MFAAGRSSAPAANALTVAPSTVRSLMCLYSITPFIQKFFLPLGSTLHPFSFLQCQVRIRSKTLRLLVLLPPSTAETPKIRVRTFSTTSKCRQFIELLVLQIHRAQDANGQSATSTGMALITPPDQVTPSQLRLIAAQALRASMNCWAQTYPLTLTQCAYPPSHP
jgi:hypothetical protein